MRYTKKKKKTSTTTTTQRLIITNPFEFPLPSSVREQRLRGLLRVRPHRRLPRSLADPGGRRRRDSDDHGYLLRAPAAGPPVRGSCVRDASECEVPLNFVLFLIDNEVYVYIIFVLYCELMFVIFPYISMYC